VTRTGPGPGPGTTVPRVLVCEDSPSYAAALTRLLEYDGDIKVSAVCTTAAETMAALPRVTPDLVTMDLDLPDMNGLKAVEEIMSSRPLPILVLSGLVGMENGMSAAALACGALDAIAKDDPGLRDPAGAAAAALRRRVRILCRATVIRHLRAGLRSHPDGPALTQRASVIGVCASTGGPQILVRLLNALPTDYPIPLLVVQHIGAEFTDGLAAWLDQVVRLPVAVATEGAPVRAGVWIAPSGAHLRLTPAGRLSLDSRGPAGPHCPSGNVLLESIAASAGRAGVAIVLSGMGSDGAAGAAAVRRAGGLAIAQDQPSSVVFGMPRAAIELGVELVLAPAEIAATLVALKHAPLRVPR
jgi:two-component system, chemotaxis family, protein-glutamate methylesterase/glutaminase